MDFDYCIAPVLFALGSGAVACVAVMRIRSKRLQPSKVSSWLRHITWLTTVAFATLIGTSALTNAWLIHSFWNKHPPAGNFYPVNGGVIHLVCRGTGSPTLILEAGLGNDSLIWSDVQGDLSKTLTVCSYDRAGLGWSQKDSALRDADHITKDLKILLDEANVPHPLVMIGHSIGGLYARDYAGLYQKEVVGLILIDSATPWQNRVPAIRAADELPPRWLLHVAMIVGVQRWMGMCSGKASRLPGQNTRLQAEDLCRTHVSEVTQEIDSFEATSAEVERHPIRVNLPVLVISHDPNTLRSGEDRKLVIQQQAIWNDMQEEMKRLSSDDRRIIARGSSHYIQLDRADLLAEVVLEFVRQVQQGYPQPLTGTTIVR